MYAYAYMYEHNKKLIRKHNYIIYIMKQTDIQE